MAAVTLTTLRARVRERADMTGSAFVADSATSLDAWINEAHQKLHAMVVDAFGEEYVSSTSAFTTLADTADYALPADFYKGLGVDLTIAGDVVALLPYMQPERNFYRNSHLLADPSSRPRYRLVGSNLRLYPIPQAGLTGSIRYAPAATTLTNGGDSVNYPNGWERFIVIDAAIQCLIKEESDVRALMVERERIEKEIEATKEARDLAAPKRVIDVSDIDVIRFW